MRARVLYQMRAPYRPITSLPLPPIVGPKNWGPGCCSTPSTPLNAALHIRKVGGVALGLVGSSKPWKTSLKLLKTWLIYKHLKYGTESDITLMINSGRLSNVPATAITKYYQLRGNFYRAIFWGAIWMATNKMLSSFDTSQIYHHSSVVRQLKTSIQSL